MEQIIVNRLGKAPLPLFRRNPLSTVTKAVQNQKLLGEDVVNVTVETVEPLDLAIGDSILVFGRQYTINQLPKAAKAGDRFFTYELTFEGPQYALFRVLFLNQDVSGFATGPEFTLTGDLKLFAEVLLTNISRVSDAGIWVLGNVPLGTPTKDITFNSENALSVLQKLCSEFETEFSISFSANATNTLHFGKQGQVLGHEYEYGKGRGLYNLSRETFTGEAFVNRLYAYGGNKNIPSSYRGYSSRLRLDDDLSFLENLPSKSQFGLIEGTKVWEDIYPHRIGKVTSVGALTAGVKVFTLTDTSMDFDLNEESGPAQTVGGKTVKQYKYLIGGVTPKLHVNSGGLAGYEFEVQSYDHATKTFTLICFQDERGMLIPSSGSTAFQAGVGDSYVLLDLLMPASYVAAAENELKTKAQTYLDDHSKPRVQYNLMVDERYLKAQTVDNSTIPNFFDLGDYVRIIDKSLDADGASRVTGFTRDVLRHYQYTLELSDTYQISTLTRILTEQAAVQTIIKLNNLVDAQQARAGWRTTEELRNMVFDPDDYFDGGNIRPESIETSMIVVGAKSQQFVLNCVIEPNFEGQVNIVHVNAGSLTHYTVQETIITWQIKAETTTIPDDEARYIYARCHKTNKDDAAILFSTAQLKPDEDATYYHFLVGILHSKEASGDVRWISLTYGATAINGRFIKTGRIQSFDGKTYFDLDLGEIGGKITFVAADGSLKPIEELTKTTIDGGVVTSGSVMLAGEGGAVKAGITGQGANDASVRFWAGVTFSSRSLAPFRVTQGGEVFARKRVELMNENNIGQAGIAGSTTTTDGAVRFWAGKPYEGRNTAPFRVLADGTMVTTQGLIGKWVLNSDGIVNNNGRAYVIARTSTNPHRTEARIGAGVFPGVFEGKGASYFVANEPDSPIVNYAAIFEAANGPKNFAIFANQGISMFGESLTNGRRYLGIIMDTEERIIDPSEYDVIEIYPTGAASIRFGFTSLMHPVRNGKLIRILNCNDTTGSLTLKNIVRGAADWQLAGGQLLTLLFSNNFWYIDNVHDNNFGASSPPFPEPPVNVKPTKNGQIPSVTISDRTTLSWQIPAGIFIGRIGDTALSFYITSDLPAGITFDGGTRTFFFDEDALNAVIPVAVKVTNSANLSEFDNFTLTLQRPSLVVALSVKSPIGNITISGTGTLLFPIPDGTFTGGTGALTFSATGPAGTALPAGVRFDPDVKAFTLPAGLGVYALVVIVADSAGQSISDAFTITVVEQGTIPVTPPRTVVSSNPDDFTSDAVEPPINPPDPGTGNPNAEKDVNLFTSQSGNDGGNK